MKIRLTLFGSFQLQIEGQPPLTLRTNKMRALLAYLAVENGRSHNRATLAAFLWPDFPEKQARRNLTQTLYRLRKVVDNVVPGLAARYLQISAQQIAVLPDDNLFCDVVAFQQLLTAVSTHQHNHIETCTACLARLEKAVALYQGELLQGLHLPEQSPFSEWWDFMRAHLQQQLIQTLDTLLTLHEKQGNQLKRAQYARQQVALEPWLDSGWQHLLAALAALDKRNEALGLYEQHRQSLQAELGVLPSKALQLLHEQLLRETEVAVGDLPNPYKGLNTFTAADATRFFGREAYLAELAQRLAAQGLAAVVGASGSGKSSVLQAGLLSHLQLAEGEKRPFLICRPGKQPLQTLAESLTELLVAKRPLSPPPDKPLLIIDQFEELFTLTPSAEIQKLFLDQILVATQAEAPFAVVLALRADFMGEAISYRPFAEALQIGALLLGPMTTAEMERAIVEPAQQQRVTFESGLVERLLHDIGADGSSELGRLPLLQFALYALWQNESSGQLTHLTYEAIGRLDGALSQYADNIYAQLDASQQAQARSLFLRLVQPTQHVADTRRPVSQSELTPSTWLLVQQLATARLLVTNQDEAGQGVVELVHEVLIRYWERYQQWLAEDRAFQHWQQRLLAIMASWEETKQDEGGLLRGLPLGEAEGWLAQRGEDLPDNIHDFISASLALRAREAAAAAAQAERDRAYTMSLEAQLAFINRNTERALHHALAATQTADPPAVAQLILSEAAYAPGTQCLFAGHSDGVFDFALLPAGERFLSASLDGTLRLWSLTTRATIRVYEGHDQPVSAVATNGRLALSGDLTGMLICWEVETGKIVRQWAAHDGFISRVVFLPDKTQALSAADDGLLKLWELATGTCVRTFRGHEKGVLALAVGKNGRLALSGGSDNHLILWEIETGEIRHHFTGHCSVLPIKPNPHGHWGKVRDVAFFPGEERAVSVGEDQQLIIWDLAQGKMLSRHWHRTNQHSVAIHPDGQKLLLGSFGGVVWLFDNVRQRNEYPMAGHGRSVTRMAFVGLQQALTASNDGTLRLWSLRDGAEQWRVTTTDNMLTRFGLHPNGRLALSGFVTGELRLWDVETKETLRRWQGHDDVVMVGQFSRDGRYAFTASGDIYGEPQDCSLAVWEVETGREVYRLEQATNAVISGAMSDNGRFLLAGDRDGHLWQVDLAQQAAACLATFPSQEPFAVAYTPDTQTVAVGLIRDRLPTKAETLVLLNRETGAVLWECAAHAAGTHALGFLANGRLLATAGLDNAIRIWEVATGSCQQTLLGHQASITQLNIHKNGRYLVSGGHDRAVMLWDLTQGEALRRWTGHQGLVVGLGFGGNGRLVISAAIDSTVRCWRFDETQDELLAWIGGNRHVG